MKQIQFKEIWSILSRTMLVKIYKMKKNESCQINEIP